jgi:hypothetical protein
MQKKFLFLSLFITMGINAQEWVTITPLPYCEKFTIEYNFDDGYNVRYKPTPVSDYVTHTESLKNINDLGSMTDVLVESAASYCPLGLNYEEDSSVDLSGVACHPETQNTTPFSDSYSDLLKDIILAINRNGNNCDDVIPLIALQDEISQLSGDDLITFDKSGHILKLIAGKDQGLLIDHHQECGGSSGSQKFIENLILLETRNACIFPEPPGFMSFEKAKEISHELAKKYPNSGLLKLAGKSDKITKDVVLKFTDEILKSQLSNIFGEKVSVDEFINKLDVIKKLKQTKSSKTLDFASYILKVDAPMQVIEQSIPLLIRDNFSSMLPKELTEHEKNLFLEKKITPIVTNKFNSCIADFKKKVKYPNPYSGKTAQRKLIKHRKKLEKKFCHKNPEICKTKICGGDSVSFGSTDPKKSDLAQMQACLFSGLTLSIKPLLKEVIAQQKETFKEYFEMDEAMINEVSNKAYDELYMCADKKVKDISGDKYKEGYTQNVTALYSVTSTQFVDALKSCAHKTEENLTGDFVTLLLGKMDAVEKAFGTEDKIELYGQTLNKGASSFARAVIAATVPSCLKQQNDLKVTNVDYKVSAANCRASIEMEAGARLIAKTIKETYKENKIPKAVADREIENFNKCSQASQEDATAALLNPKHKTPIMDAKNAETFLKNNNNFYKCVTRMITNTADLIANKAIEKTLKENKDKISDFETVMNLKPKVVEITKKCFSSKMKTLGSWPSFIEFNAQKGLEKLQAKCTAEATEFILPKIIISETSAKLGALVSTNIIDKNEVKLIMSKIAAQLELDYNIRVPISLGISREEYVIKEAYKKFTVDSVKGTDQFIEKIYNVTLGKAIPEIKTNIIDELVNRSKPGFNFDELKKILTPNCINAYYEQNKTNIEELVALISKQSKGKKKGDLRELFIGYLQQGLISSQTRGRYYDMVAELKLMCKNPGEYKDLSKIAKLGVADDILINVVKTKLQSSFYKVAQDQCYKDIKDYNIRLLPGLLSQLCEERLESSDEKNKLKSELLLAVTYPRDKALIDFILDKKFNGDMIVKNKIQGKFIEDLLYKDKEALDFIYKNLDKVSAGIPETTNKLISIITKKIFLNTEEDSFAEHFVENQLIAGIGLGGYDIARTQVRESLQDIPWYYKAVDIVGSGIITDHAENAFNKKWQYSGVKHYLGLNKATKENKDKLISAVYENAITPQLDANASEEERLEKRNKLAELMTNYISDNKPHKNPNYRPPRHGSVMGGEVLFTGNSETISFKEKLAYDVEASVAQKVKRDIANTTIEIKDNLLDALNESLLDLLNADKD